MKSEGKWPRTRPVSVSWVRLGGPWVLIRILVATFTRWKFKTAAEWFDQLGTLQDLFSVSEIQFPTYKMRTVLPHLLRYCQDQMQFDKRCWKLGHNASEMQVVPPVIRPSTDGEQACGQIQLRTWRGLSHRWSHWILTPHPEWLGWLSFQLNGKGN